MNSACEQCCVNSARCQIQQPLFMPCKFCTGYHFNCIFDTLPLGCSIFRAFQSYFSIYTMAQTRGASSSASQHGAHSQRGGRSTPSQPAQTPVPSTQHGYGTRRSSGSSRAPVPPPVSSLPPKRTRISRPGESFKAPPSPPASTIPGPSHLAEVLKRSMIAGPPLPGNRDIRDKPFHDEICYFIDLVGFALFQIFLFHSLWLLKIISQNKIG